MNEVQKKLLPLTGRHCLTTRPKALIPGSDQLKEQFHFPAGSETGRQAGNQYQLPAGSCRQYKSG
jgi:hypothetical protein